MNFQIIPQNSDDIVSTLSLSSLHTRSLQKLKSPYRVQKSLVASQPVLESHAFKNLLPREAKNTLFPRHLHPCRHIITVVSINYNNLYSTCIASRKRRIVGLPWSTKRCIRCSKISIMMIMHDDDDPQTHDDYR